MKVLGAPVSHVSCEHAAQSKAAAEVARWEPANDQPCKFSAIDDRESNMSANPARATERIRHVRFTDSQLQHEGLEDQQRTQNALEPNLIMPFAAARFYDALHIPHAHIFSRSKNPWLGVALVLSPICYFLPYNIMLYGYLGNYHPVLFPFSLSMVAPGSFLNIFSLRLPPHQVNKSWAAMTSVLLVTICLSVPCLGSLVISVLPGGRTVPGGNLLVFCALLFIHILALMCNVRCLRSCSLLRCFTIDEKILSLSCCSLHWMKRSVAAATA